MPGVIYVDGMSGHSSFQSPAMGEPHRLSRGQTEGRGTFPTILKGPGLKKVRFQLVFEDERLGSFFHCEEILSENNPKEKTRPASTESL